ncbi:MAG: HD-GYP domain-containing protein [Gaiellaceae bacterium]
MTSFAHVLRQARPSAIESYVMVLAIIAAGLLAGVIAAGETLEALWVVAVLAFAAAVADRGVVRLSNSLEISVAVLPALFAAVVIGPLAAMVVAAATPLSFLLPGQNVDRPYLRWATYTLSRSITGCVAGLAAAVPLGLVENVIGATLAATAVAAVVAVSLDVLFVSVTMRLRGVASLLEGAKVLGPLIASSVPLYTPVLAFLAFAYLEISPWTLPLFFGPALAAHRLFVLYQDQRQLADDLRSVNERLERASLSFASALVATLDARDRYTAGHSAAVAIYARDIAARMGLAPDQQELAHLCGLVHDIGKVGLLPGLLEKEGPLTLEERRQMEEHSAIGERILARVEDYAETAKIVRHHHERWDGEGYPDRLGHQDIPLISRIICVADAYNAMTSDRPYRDAMPSRVARLRLAQAADSQFDTGVVAAFEAILAGASEEYRLARDQDFRFDVQEAGPQPAVAV